MYKKTVLSTTLFILLATAGVVSRSSAAHLTPIGVDTEFDRSLTVVVHGFNPTLEHIEPLALWLDARGLRTSLFEYNDHLPLAQSASDFAHDVLRELSARPADRLLIIAHSMGGLVARHAVTENHASELANLDIPIDLVTIATPHGGIKAANMSLITFGIGRKSFRDLGTWSRFIRKPGALAAGVRHVKVATLETGARRRHGDREIRDDLVALSRQAHPVVDAFVAESHLVEAGHVGVLNSEGSLPRTLEKILDSVIETDRELLSAQASPSQTFHDMYGASR